MGSALFTATNIKNCSLKNRITMAPMFTGYGNADGTISQAVLEHYKDMGASGVGLVVVENMIVDSQRSRFGRLMAIDSDETIPDLSRLARVIKEGGTAAFCQINHGGRLAMVPNPIAPSPVPAFDGPAPEEMNSEMIETVIQKYIDAALRAKQAGFDGVEIHGATGYLPAQFLSPRTNLRNDRYGGSLDNRMRFGLQLVHRVQQALGQDYPVGYRFMADEWQHDGFHLDEAKVYAKKLDELGVGYLSVTAGTYESMFSPDKIALSMQENYMAYLAGSIKEVVAAPVIAAGRIATPEAAERILASNQADLVGLARVLFADPCWPQKAAEGKSKEITRCRTNCDACIKLVMKQKPVICAAWDNLRKEKFKNLLNNH